MVECNIFIMENDKNELKNIIIGSMEYMIGNNTFSNESAGLTIGIEPLLIKFLEGHVDEPPPLQRLT